jgi:hypothetical protein
MFFLLYWRYNPVWILASTIDSGGFVTVDYSGVGLLAPRLNLSLEDQGLHFVWPAPFDRPEPYAPASIALCVIGAHKPPLHDKTVVLEEDLICHDYNYGNILSVERLWRMGPKRIKPVYRQYPTLTSCVLT